MANFLNGIIFYLLLKSFKVSIVRTEFDAIVHLIPGNEMSLNCSEISSITMGNVSVQNIDKCDRNQQECNLNSNDYKLIKRCEGSTSCQVDGSLLTSACLWEGVHFNLSYICKESYEYVSCYRDNILGFRVFGEAHQKNTAMSADICFDICTQTSYEHKFFGTQFGHECFCGDGEKLDSYPFSKRKSECNMPCLEHNYEMCGDRNRMSVYKITTQNLITRSCLKVNQTNMIQDCKANQLQEDSLCIKFDVFSNDNIIDETCRDQEKEIENKLYRFCENTPLNGDCVYNLSRFLPADIIMKPPAKYISIVYSCKVKDSTTRSTLSSFGKTSSTQSNSLSTSSTQNISIKASSILMSSLAASTTLNIYYSFSTSTSDYANETNSKVTPKSNIGIIIGSVVSSMIFLCIVFIGVCIGRRFVLCNKSHGKLRNNPETNDYVGNQTITLPNIVDRYDYTRNFETNNSQTLNHKTSTPTYIVQHDDTFKPSPESNDDEYAVVDPTAESSFNETPKASTKCSENCMILDPNQTGIDRSKFANTNQADEFAKPIHNTNGHQDDLYALSPEGTYDHSGTTRHHKDQDTIYTHAVDNVYDSASRGVNIARNENTYDHFFGKETEDEYNISRH